MGLLLRLCLFVCLGWFVCYVRAKWFFEIVWILRRLLICVSGWRQSFFYGVELVVGHCVECGVVVLILNGFEGTDGKGFFLVWCVSKVVNFSEMW